MPPKKGSYHNPSSATGRRPDRGPKMTRTEKKIRGEIEAARLRKMKKYPFRFINKQ